MVETDAPPKVVIIEYVAVADAFFPEGKVTKFVNAVLDVTSLSGPHGADSSYNSWI